MREVSVEKIKNMICGLCVKANVELRRDVLSGLKKAHRSETAKKAKKILGILIENAGIAKAEGLAICQDTGMACVYLEIGQGVKLTGGDFQKAVNDGVRLGYNRGYFRNSVADPFTRRNTGDNAPAVVHTSIVRGDRVKITVVPKGFGCENKSQIRMFSPTAGRDEIKGFIVDVVRQTGPAACPPFVVGVGIGGTFEKAAELSKEALLKKVTSQVTNLEKGLLREINKLNIGPAGVGGKTTALSVNVLAYPTHIAGLPVAVSIGCHAQRSATGII